MSTLAAVAPDPEYLDRRLRDERNLPPPEKRRALRKAAGLSTLDIARAVGVTRNAVIYWETGRSQPRGENLTRYVEVLRKLRRAS